MLLEEIKETFDLFDDWEDKYRFVIELGKDVLSLADNDKTDINLVRGCQSQVWLTHTQDQDGTLHFHLDSDAHIVRGLIAIVQACLSGKKPPEILAFDIEAVFEVLELLEHLSLARGNGLRAMIQRILLIAEQSAQQS